MPSPFMKAISLAVLGFLALPPAALGGEWQERHPTIPPLPYDGTETIAGTFLKIDAARILRSWRLKGILVCMHGPKPHACLWVENAWPCGLVEVVRKRASTHYVEMQGPMKGLEPLRLFGNSSSHSALAGDGTNLQFAEARVYTFVPTFPGADLGAVPIARPWGPLFQVDYITELDGFAWRNPWVDRLTAPESTLAELKSCDRFPDPVNCAGTWGSYFPRIGFVTHPSEVIASHLQALRAGRAAARPIGRAVIAPYPFEPRTGHYLQMLRPILRPSVSIGSPATKLIETGTRSPFGAYLFMHYGIFETCRGCLPVLLTPPRAPTP